MTISATSHIDKPTSKATDPSLLIFRWDHIAKLALHTFFQECIDGTYKTFFQRFAPWSRFWTLSTDKNFTNDQRGLNVPNTNPLTRPIQLARYWQEVQQKTPLFLIRSSSYTRPCRSLGGSTFSSRAENGDQIIGTLEESTVSIEISLSSLSDEDTGLMCSFVDLGLGPIGKIIHQGTLYPHETEQASWGVTLPFTWNVSGLNESPIGDDKKQRMWSQSISFDVTVENINFYQYPTPITNSSFTNSTAEPDFTIPSTNLRVGQTVKLSTSMRPGEACFVSSDFRKAIVDDGEFLVAKKTGEVTISMVNSSDQTQIYKSTTITII